MVEIILLFILPVYFIYKYPLAYRYRPFIFIPTLIGISILILLDNFTFYRLGFRIDNFKSSLLPYLLFTFLGCISLVLIAKHFNKKFVEKRWKNTHFLSMCVVLSFFQELVYRGYLMPKLQNMFTSVFTIVLINSLIFSYIHIIYPDKIRNLLLSFVGGTGFAFLYYYYPNIYLITVSHSMLNFTAVLFGLIGPNNSKNKQVFG